MFMAYHRVFKLFFSMYIFLQYIRILQLQNTLGIIVKYSEGVAILKVALSQFIHVHIVDVKKLSGLNSLAEISVYHFLLFWIIKWSD